VFVVYPINIDYLIEPVRLKIGDYESTVFSDSLVRGALIASTKQLQRYWGLRYLVYTDTMFITPQPDTVASGYVYVLLPDGYATIASGYAENDVFRNPAYTFIDQTTAIIAQADEDVITLAAAIILIRARLGSSASAFVNWSDGEYSYSNVSSSATLRSMLADLLAEFNLRFKPKRAGALRGDFTNFVI
jgi:hypothetical protein